MVAENEIQLNIYTFIWITTKNYIKENEMKHKIVNCSIKEICLANLEEKSTKKNILCFAVKNQYLQKRRTHKNKMQQQQQKAPTDENINQMHLYNTLNEKDKDSLIHTKSVEEQLDKENYLKSYQYDHLNRCINRTEESNKKNHSSIRHGDNIEQGGEHIIVAEGDGEVDAEEEEDIIGRESRTNFAAEDLVNNYTQSKCKINDEQEKEWPKGDNDVNLLKTEATPAQPLAAIAETHTVTTTNVKNVTQHLNQRYLAKDFGEQILHGQQLNVHNLLDVAGSLCAGPMGALCDMAAFSKLDFSAFGDPKDHSPSNQDFLAKKYYHPLYAHGVCRWPGCELPLEDMASFVKHLKTEHCLDDRSTAQARVQMQVVSQLEMHLQKERDRLQAMMHHLYLTKHFAMPEESQENISHIRYKNDMRSVSTTPDLSKSNNNSNDDSDGANDLQALLINSGNINSTRKRICDKSPLALAGEIQRNREFYKNADVRPPFTYASLIRQSIIESPDKQLTLNEIYNWFQNTFCYFRRNAATWKNAIRTNLSLHKCFVRYEDDFGSFWMVDDSEFVKRRHLSRGRPRKYEPSSSPNSNSQQFGSTTASTIPHEVGEGSSAINDAIATTSPDLSAAGSSSRTRCTSSSSSNIYHRSGNKNSGTENNGGNDDYDICEVSQRSPAGCQSHLQGGKKLYCGSKQRPHLQSSVIGIAIKTNINSLIDHNRIASRTNNGGGVATTGNDPGVSGIGEIGSVGSLGVDNHNGIFNTATTGVETEDPTNYDFHTQTLSSDAILSSPPGSKGSIGRHSPNVQNMWSFGPSLSDEVSSAEFACINNDRYRNLVTGLHLQSLTQRHHFQQHKPTSQRMHPKTPQQNILRNNISNQQHDIRTLHQTHGYHIYPTNQDENQHQKLLLDQQNQSLGQNIFGVNNILSSTDKYFSHSIECRNDGEIFKHESFNPRQHQQQHHQGIRLHSQSSRSDLLNDEITNQINIHHHNGHELDVKYTPPIKTLYNFDTQSLNRSDVILHKRPADDIYSNKDTTEEDSGIVDCEREEIQRKRKKNHLSSLNYDDVEIKAEADSESELRNIDIPLRTKSY